MAEIDRDLESIVPKLVSVLMDTFSNFEFSKALTLFNSQSNCKVTFTVDDLFSQYVSFISKYMKLLENGYKGYEIEFKQINTDANHGSDKHYAEVQVNIHGLDWAILRKEETKEAVESYMKALSMFVSFTNTKSKLGLVYKIDEKPNEQDRISQTFKLALSEAGVHEFKLLFSDCYGVNKSQTITLNVK